MNMNKKEELIEQYEDAAFALMMSDYAELEGNRLLQEFDEAKARGEVPPVPAELDARCRRLIHKAYQQERNRERMKKILCFAGRTAAVWFVVIGICSTLVLSVEALRTPVVNFIIEQHDKFTTINLGKELSSTPTTSLETKDPAMNQDKPPLDGLLPEGYSVSQFRARENGTFVAQYKNHNGDQIVLSSTLGNGTINLDSQETNICPIIICGLNGYLIDEGKELLVFWFDEEQNYSYQLRATNTNTSELWKIAEGYISRNKGDS